MSNTETLLRAIFSLQGRAVFPPEKLADLIAPNAGGEKQLRAYNECDGSKSQHDICKNVGLDKGSLSRSISRWIELGILIRIGTENLPLHVYPLPKELLKSTSKKGV